MICAPPRRLQDGSHDEARGMVRSSGDVGRYVVDWLIDFPLFNYGCSVDFPLLFDRFLVGVLIDILLCFHELWLILILKTLIIFCSSAVAGTQLRCALDNCGFAMDALLLNTCADIPHTIPAVLLIQQFS